MANIEVKKQKRDRRHARVRAKIFGTDTKPRLAVFKSNRYIYAQVINDEKGMTIASASSLGAKKGTMREKAEKVGEAVAKAAFDKKVKRVVFDRGGFLYAGLIKVLADSARKGGLEF
jgi:large subunit ribosomal protein L18